MIENVQITYISDFGDNYFEVENKENETFFCRLKNVNMWDYLYSISHLDGLSFKVLKTLKNFKNNNNLYIVDII